MIYTRFLYALLAAIGLNLAASAAQAQFYVRSPEVHKGELEIEEHGAAYSGPGEDERLRQTHELSDAVSDFTYKFDIEVEF